MSAVPAQYNRQANFVTDAQSNANITVSQIATELDAEFDAINTALDQTQGRLAEVQRDDGQLAFQVVSVPSLSIDVLMLLKSENALFKGAWATGTAYSVGHSVVFSNAPYYCVLAHTSGVFATDLAAGRWVVPNTTVPDGSISTPKIVDENVTAAKLASGAVTSDKIASSGVTTEKIAVGSVTTAKIADGAITAAKLDPNAKIGGATGAGTDRTFYENDQNVTANYTITSGKNAGSFGPITIADGINVTIPDGSTYTIV